MSHHYSGPDFGFPHGDARLDLTDLYVFPSPGREGKTIFVMNVHPSVGVNPPGPTTAEPFAPNAIYELKIDTNGDAVADIAYRVRFSSSDGGSQTAAVYRVDGTQAAGTGDGGQLIVEGVPVSTGKSAHVAEAGDYRIFAGWRSDPFFFDTEGALNNLQFTGVDFFTNGDVCSIVIEVPTSTLGPNAVGLWHRTVDGASGTWVQADRGARPSQAVFLAGDRKADFLASEPKDDAQFIPVFAHSLEHTGGYSPDEAMRVARTLLPDILFYDPVGRRFSRTMAAHSPTTRLTFSLASSQMAESPAITWVPIKTFFPNSLSWVRHMKIGLRSRSQRDSPRSQPCSLHPLLRCRFAPQLQAIRRYWPYQRPIVRSILFWLNRS